MNRLELVADIKIDFTLNTANRITKKKIEVRKKIALIYLMLVKLGRF